MTPSGAQQGSSKHILVIANETVGSDALRETIVASAAGTNVRVTVVAPALNTRLQYWMTDDSKARAEAQARLSICLEGLRREGIIAEGRIGDADPFVAISDAVHISPVDEIIIATHPEGRSNWLERGLPELARASFPQPIQHVIVYPAGVAAQDERPDSALGSTA